MINFNTDASKVKRGGRKAKKITVNEFKEKLLEFLIQYSPGSTYDRAEFMKSNDPLSGYTGSSSLLGRFTEAIESDIVTKDLSKIRFGHDNGTAANITGNSNFLGLHVTESGIPFIGARLCGDEEFVEVYFIVYFDGKNIRGYVPYYGNTYNPKTKAAFGIDHEDEDEVLMNSIGKTLEDDFEDIQADETKLLIDVNSRITVVP